MTVTVPCSIPVGTTFQPAAWPRARHLVGQGRGRDVPFADRLAEQRVAHGAADDACLLAVAVEAVEQIAASGGLESQANGPAHSQRRLDELAVLEARRHIAGCRPGAAAEMADQREADARRDQRREDESEHDGASFQASRRRRVAASAPASHSA